MVNKEIPILTEEIFQRLIRDRQFGEATEKAARLVLVEGRKPAAVCRELGFVPQQLSRAVRKILKDLPAAPGTPDNWVYVGVWAPPELSTRILQMVDDARRPSPEKKPR